MSKIFGFLLLLLIVLATTAKSQGFYHTIADAPEILTVESFVGYWREYKDSCYATYDTLDGWSWYGYMAPWVCVDTIYVESTMAGANLTIWRKLPEPVEFFEFLERRK
jgi:hypothetical protein